MTSLFRYPQDFCLKCNRTVVFRPDGMDGCVCPQFDIQTLRNEIQYILDHEHAAWCFSGDVSCPDSYVPDGLDLTAILAALGELNASRGFLEMALGLLNEMHTPTQGCSGVRTERTDFCQCRAAIAKFLNKEGSSR